MCIRDSDAGFDTAIPFSVSAKTISVRVYSPDANTVVRLKVEDASNAGISVETEAMTTGVNTWETLAFNFANQVDGTAELNMANTYDKASIFFDFGNAGTGKTYLWDDVVFETETTPSFDLPVDFEEAVTLVDFGGNASTQVADPTDASNTVAQSIKTDGAATYAGTTINGDAGFDLSLIHI